MKEEFMSSSRSAVVLTFVMLLVPIYIRAQKNIEDPWKFPDLSATQVFHTAEYEIPMKVYHSGARVRVDRSPAMATLYAITNNKVYDLTVYPDGSRQCVAMTPDQAKMVPSPLELLFGTYVKRIPAGTEVVEGHKCKIEIAFVTRADGKVIKSKVWEAEDLKGVPVKIESQLPEAKLTAFYRDIVLGASDKALFTPLEKCTAYEKMGQIAEHKIIK
jgi:hypothetical protein